MHNYHNKLPILIIIVFMLGGWLISSCKKESKNSYTEVFLAGGREWQLVSQQVSVFNGDTLKRTDTLNRTCTQNQVFNFNGNGTCTYTNYSCINQTSQGTWKIITQDSLRLQSNVTCKDTSKTGSSTPFENAEIVNLGQNSLVLQVVKFSVIRTVPNKLLEKKVTRYAFIH